MGYREGEQGNEEIAKGYALQHSEDAQMVETERVAAYGMTEPDDALADEKQQ